MVTAAYLAYAVTQLVLLVLAARLFSRNPHWILIPFLVNVFGLFYDNLAIGLGHLIGPGQTLMALNYPRYLIHALTTSLFGLVGLHLARHAGVKWAQGRGMLVVFCVITLPALARAIYIDLIMLRMEPVVSMGTLRYANASVNGPPLPEIVSILMVIVCGIGIARHTRWPWLLLGALVMFVLAALAPTIGIVANLGEIALVAGIVATAHRFLLPEAAAQQRYAVGSV